nr:TcpQ domain-containing protein [uncultured Ralstonia sp.]
MLLAAVALAAWFNLPTAQAATSRQNAIPEEAEELSGDGWQLLSAGESMPKAPTKKSVPASKQAAAPTASKQAAGSSTEPSTAASKVALTETTPAAVSASTPPVSAPTTFSLVAGESVESQLLAWAKRAKWNVLWSVQDAWVVPGNKDYGTDFESAVKSVTEDLAGNGADILGDSWRGNNMIVITQNGAAGQ